MCKELILILFAAVPVDIVTNPESATQLVGSSATFNCAASGTPPLTFMWYKAGQSTPLEVGGNVYISNQSNESSLTLTSITPSDAGAYYCMASNILVAGTFTSNSTLANLTVHGKHISHDVLTPTSLTRPHLVISLPFLPSHPNCDYS